MPYLIYAVSFLCSAAGLIIAFCYVLRSGKVVWGTLIGWGLSIVCIILVSMVFPAIVAVYNKEYAAFFPEATGVPMIMFMGWVPAYGLAALAGRLKQGSEPRKKTESPPTTRQEHEDGKN